jgi:ABC-type sugar transport system ATPase subunit
MSDYSLQMNGISKRFGPVQALSEVTFSVRKGTVHALVGENGAGKSTLMKILAGVYRPDGGTIEISGKRMEFASPKESLNAGVSMIYQELALAEDLTAAENIFLGEEPKGRLPFTIDHARIVAETRKLAETYSFEVDTGALVANLSVGDCQIIEILKALRRNASIIVMDEPSSSLSEAEVKRLFEVVRRLRERGMSIIYISHRLEEVVELADDISVLRDGRLVHSEAAGRLDISSIVRHMVGRELNDFFPERVPEIGDVYVEVENLSTNTGVSGVSFSVRRGEIVGMAGLVGAGRTDVASALFGIIPKTGGTVRMDKLELAINSPADAIQNGIGYLTEDRKRTGLCLDLACSWNVTLPNLTGIGMKHVIKPKREDEIVSSLTSRINIKWSSPQAAADSLSGGNQQKLVIARWLLADSNFIIFDEPTRGVDVGAKKEIYSLLNSLAAQGKAVLIISSELPELFGVTDRILVVRRGKLVGDLITRNTTPDAVMHLAAVE